jgi:large subunit ribosomal protein L5e
MAFLKVIKNKSYFKRYQTKFRRRREGKTDYRARKRLVAQDKNKYNSPKYRFVVRISNCDITTQIAYAKIEGDHVLVAAYSHELPKYGMPVGLTNYAAAYATGLLAARRLLTKLKLADKYQGNQNIDGSDYRVEELADGPRPFRAYLDVGLHRTTTGSKVFAAMKGACDGGLDIPHGETRFVGYDKEGKKLKAEILKKHIFAGHVAAYMKSLREENPTKFQKQFADYGKNKIKPEELESKWAAVHKSIRSNPVFVKKENKKKGEQKRFGPAPLTLEQRKKRAADKIAAIKAAKQ